MSILSIIVDILFNSDMNYMSVLLKTANDNNWPIMHEYQVKFSSRLISASSCLQGLT